MNTTNTRTLTTAYCLLLALLSAPLVSLANTQKSVTIGDKVLSNTQIASTARNRDYTIQHMNQAWEEIGANNLRTAQSDIHKAEQKLLQLQKFGQGAVTENITVTHGAKINQLGTIDTAIAYYSPDMQDMRLLRMAETNFKNGDSNAAFRDLSAVRFPYVTANVQLSTDDAVAIAAHVNQDLKNKDAHAAAFDAGQFTAKAHASAGLFDSTGT